MTKPELIHCAAGNPRFAQIAINHNFTYGAQLPAKVYFAPDFVDQNWRNPNREKYMKALAEHRPRIATVLDLEYEHQLDEVLSWSEEASQYVSEAVIIIPKAMSIIDRLPTEINEKQVRLGYSVPTKFAGTSVPVWEFGRRPAHLLGGSPKRQRELMHYLNVKSVDGNYAHKLASKFNTVCVPTGDAKLTDFYQKVDTDAPYIAFELSCMNIQAMWAGCNASIRWAKESDILAIKKIANQYKRELGFVNSAALKTAVSKHELTIAELDGVIVGFCNWHKRRDGIVTVYEIATHKNYGGMNIGKGLLASIPAKHIRLKCTQDNDANDFYARVGFSCIGEEVGRKRPLNVWQRIAR